MQSECQCVGVLPSGDKHMSYKPPHNHTDWLNWRNELWFGFYNSKIAGAFNKFTENMYSFELYVYCEGKSME